MATWKQIIEKAREQYHDGAEIQIDEPQNQEHAKNGVVPAEGGYWVKAYVFVREEDL